MRSRKIYAAVLFLLLLCIPLSASAHRGRTDSSGGHYDRSTGEYHYHHGYEAHQHPNGVCPYDYDDQTNHSSGSSSSSSSSANPYRSEDSSRVNKTYSTSSSSKKNSGKTTKKPSPAPAPESTFDWRPLLWGALAVSALVILYKLAAFLKKRHTYKQQYGGFSARELAHVPKDVDFDENDLPHTRGALDYSDQPDEFTVYRSPHGGAYHRKGCHPAATKAVNLAALPPELIPCRRCNPPPRPTWYGDYIKILKIKRHYHI